MKLSDVEWRLISLSDVDLHQTKQNQNQAGTMLPPRNRFQTCFVDFFPFLRKFLGGRDAQLQTSSPAKRTTSKIFEVWQKKSFLGFVGNELHHRFISCLILLERKNRFFVEIVVCFWKSATIEVHRVELHFVSFCTLTAILVSMRRCYCCNFSCDRCKGCLETIWALL